MVDESAAVQCKPMGPRWGELCGKGFPFTAAGKSLAAVPNNVFLSETDRVHDSLEEEPSPGVGK